MFHSFLESTPEDKDSYFIALVDREELKAMAKKGFNHLFCRFWTASELLNGALYWVRRLDFLEYQPGVVLEQYSFQDIIPLEAVRRMTKQIIDDKKSRPLINP